MNMNEADTVLVARIEQAWALDNVEFADSLARLDPSWGSESFPLAGGQVVLWGPGLYVNAALSCGVTVDLDVDDLARLERRSASVGVGAAIELTEVSTATTRRIVGERGYHMVGETAALIRPIGDEDDAGESDLGVGQVESAADLRMWKDSAIEGWEHSTPEARRASDAYAAAAHAIERVTLYLAHDASGAVVGCASLSVRGDIATLGAMATPPRHRRRGVQAALIRHRLRIAAEQGAGVAVSTTGPGSASERNLIRLGFSRSHVKSRYEPSLRARKMSVLGDSPSAAVPSSRI